MTEQTRRHIILTRALCVSADASYHALFSAVRFTCLQATRQRLRGLTPRHLPSNLLALPRGASCGKLALGRRGAGRAGDDVSRRPRRPRTARGSHAASSDPPRGAVRRRVRCQRSGWGPRAGGEADGATAHALEDGLSAAAARELVAARHEGVGHLAPHADLACELVVGDRVRRVAVAHGPLERARRWR